MVAVSVCKDSNKISSDIPKNYIWHLTFFDKTVSLAVFEHINQIHSWVISQRALGLTVGFVPTMGALHAGHQSLVKRALLDCDRVVVSIFVNPTQFNNADDLLKYPRTLANDIELLKQSDCHAVFCPAISEMYLESEKTTHWDFGLLSTSLEGHYRPGHFDGVLTIVKKLFLAVAPDKAFFGEKDFQQLALIQKMTLEEKLPVQVVACPTVREASGLAMSSRNARLTPQQHNIALNISRVLLAAAGMGRSVHPKELEEWATNQLKSVEGLRLEYCALVNAARFDIPTHWTEEDCVLLVAAFVGEIRLIDNVIVSQ
jgi:pantoate--beta-alanine ligase